jgi:hypothetical protein
MELKKGQANPMLEAAMAISITGREPTPEEKALEEMRGPKVADRLEDDPRFRQQKEDRTGTVKMNDGSELPRWLVEGDDAAAVNVANSYEALLGGWGKHPSHGQAFDTTAVKEG